MPLGLGALTPSWGSNTELWGAGTEGWQCLALGLLPAVVVQLNAVRALLCDPGPLQT